jgi:hypothetical protein
MDLNRAREIILEELPRTPRNKIDLAAVMLVMAANIADLRKSVDKAVQELKPHYKVIGE